MQGLYVQADPLANVFTGVADRKLILEEVMAVAKGKLTIIAHMYQQHQDSVDWHDMQKN